MKNQIRLVLEEGFEVVLAEKDCVLHIPDNEEIVVPYNKLDNLIHLLEFINTNRHAVSAQLGGTP